ncbi:unnamed protein product [Urochloa decumbens]|uniref:CCHC-type domain-containing protein n=1 Tax=Urochloa decumbens TaxID=240449 RepID=A0ABC9B3S0_9POAL
MASLSRELRASTPPLTPAGDPPAATHASRPLAGDPPTAQHASSPQSVPPVRTARGHRIPRAADALDLNHCGSGSSSATPLEEVNSKQDSLKTKDIRGKAIAQDSEEGRSQLRPAAADVGNKQASYKEALVGGRTFKPRFDSSRGPEEWRENTGRRRPSAPTVWSRLGPRHGSVHDRLGARVEQNRPGINGILQLLKEKAVGRCFNCFARDHRIAVCRDPPRCVLCSRSGHKARYCPAQIRRPPSAAESCPADNASTSAQSRPAANASTSAQSRPAANASASAQPRPAANATASTQPRQATALAFIPGDPSRRPARTAACAARTAYVREAERDLLLRGLIAVQTDAHAELSCDVVLRDALHQLRIPGHALQVTRMSISKFLLRFETPELRNAAWGRGTLSAGHSLLHLVTWGRRAGASDASLPYRARVCLEGVPAHAHQIESVLHLLPRRSFVEGIDHVKEREDEMGCFILWIWCKDPDALHVQGTLEIEEPFVPPEAYCDDSETTHASVLRTVLKYDVLIHLDWVEDYSPPPSRPSNAPMVQWPARHNFVWRLGQPDALPDPPRAPVHSRLGARRDGDFRPLPRSNQFDMHRSAFGAAGPSKHRGYTGGGYMGRQRVLEANRKFMWKKKESVPAAKGDKAKASIVLNSCLWQDSETVLDVLPSRNYIANVEMVDPMLDEFAVHKTSDPKVIVREQPVIQDLQLPVMDDVQVTGTATSGEQLEVAPADQMQPIHNADIHSEVSQEDVQAHADNQVEDQMQAQSQVHATTHEDTQHSFDLNLVFGEFDDDAQLENSAAGEPAGLSQEAPEPTLLDLTKQPSDDSTAVRHRSLGKGMARLVVPLKRSLLCNPTPRTKTHQMKRTSNAEAPASSSTKALKGTNNGTVEEKAAEFLIRNSGIVT